MVAPTYGTDLTDINVVDTAGGTTNWSALGGGSAGLNSETDYFIQGDGCLSKNGFTANTRGMIYNAGATTIASGDCLFIWMRQANRNLLDTKALGGGQVLIGSGTGAYDQFYVDGNDVEGSDLLSWVCYCVDPTATPSNTTGSPSGTTYFGALWKILGSGSLKGAPNAIDAMRHGRELTVIDGDGANGYGTFDGAATFDAATTRRWGLLTPVAGGYQQQGAFVMGTTGTAVDFRDSNRNITVLDNEFAPAAFNEFEIRNASSNVEWTNITIQHLGTTSPATLTLDVGTFTGVGNRFVGCGTTSFATTSSCTATTWDGCGQITANDANLSGSTVTGYNGTANTSAVVWNVATDVDGDLDDMTFVMGSTATHAVELGTSSPTSVTFRGCTFNGYNSTATNNQNDSTFHVKRTSGTVTINLVGCTTDASDFSYRTDGATVTLVNDPVTALVTVIDAVTKSPLQGARVLLEADTGGPLAVGTDIISGTTDVNGQISDTRSYASNQPVVVEPDYLRHPGHSTRPEILLVPLTPLLGLQLRYR